MNERIEQLARQAGMVKILEEHAHEYGNGTFENTPYPELEKFAELIVRECIEHLESSVAVPNIEHSRTKTKCIRSIKEHFGVKE